MNTSELLGRPWTIRISLEEEEGLRYFVAEVAEIPGVTGDGDSEVEARQDLYAALRDTLEAMSEAGETIPVPPLWTGQMEGQLSATPRPSQLPVVPKDESDNAGTLHGSHPDDGAQVEMGHQVALA